MTSTIFLFLFSMESRELPLLFCHSFFLLLVKCVFGICCQFVCCCGRRCGKLWILFCSLIFDVNLSPLTVPVWNGRTHGMIFHTRLGKRGKKPLNFGAMLHPSISYKTMVIPLHTAAFFFGIISPKIGISII